MAELELVEYPDPFLRESTKDVDLSKEGLEEARKLARDLLDTMYAGDGAGLAANQVRRSEKIIVIDANYVGAKRPLVLINPRVTKKSEESLTMIEGCLSFPGVSFSVVRSKYVDFEAYDLTGKLKRYRGSKDPVLSRVFMHELDHLEGKLMIDYVDEELRAAIDEKFSSAAS